MTGILVWIDHFRGQALPISWEALAAGRQIANARGVPLTALVLGKAIDGVVTESFHHGADRVIKCDDGTLGEYRFEPYVALLGKVVTEQLPQVVVGPATTRGKEILAGAAADANAGLLSEVVALEVLPDSLTGTRPVYDGKVNSTATISSGTTQFVSVRSPGFTALAPDSSRSGEVVSVQPALTEDQIQTKVTAFESIQGSDVDLTGAKVIVSGGRGVGGPEGFKPLKELADALGGAVGASRAAVDAGWIPYAHQIGQTGKTVSPDLYLAVGISGAIQHQSGIRTAKVVVAINKDAEAPIFKLARYGIVGDLFKIVPALTQAVRAKVKK